MSRTKTENDRIEEIIAALNEIPGIRFTEDAWEDKAPNNYGVVELTGEIANDWGDGVKIACRHRVQITIYVSGGSHTWIEAVEDKLKALGLACTAPEREYAADIKKVRWTWRTMIRTPVTYEETEGA